MQKTVLVISFFVLAVSVRAFAIQCSSFEGDSKNACFYAKAVQKSNPEGCDKITESGWKAACLAAANKDVKACEKAERRRLMCLYSIVRQTKEPEICTKMQFWYKKKFPEAKSPDPRINSCFLEVAKASKDKKWCEQIPKGFGRRRRCDQHFAKKSKPVPAREAASEEKKPSQDKESNKE